MIFQRHGRGVSGRLINDLVVAGRGLEQQFGGAVVTSPGCGRRIKAGNITVGGILGQQPGTVDSFRPDRLTGGSQERQLPRSKRNAAMLRFVADPERPDFTDEVAAGSVVVRTYRKHIITQCVHTGSGRCQERSISIYTGFPRTVIVPSLNRDSVFCTQCPPCRVWT